MANTLTFANQTLTDANIFGGINFLHDLNTGDEFTIGNTASASVNFVTDTQLPLYSKDGTNGKFAWTQNSTSRGTYYITEVTKTNGMYEVTAYDAMILLDTNISALSLSLPMTVSAIASAIATYIGCTVSGTVTNGSLSVSELSTDLTCRQLLHYVAEASGCSVKIDGSGHLCFMYYASSGITVSATNYVSLEVADYTCAKIDNVTIYNTEGDLQAQAGSGSNALYIGSNPLLDGATNTNATNILNVVKNFQYAPFKCEMFDENGLEIGTMATFGSTTTMVMHIESSETGAQASAVGSDSRAEYNKDILTVVNETSAIAVNAQTLLNGMSAAAIAANTTLTGIYQDAEDAKATTDEINAYATLASKTVTQILNDGETAGAKAQEAIESAEQASISAGNAYNSATEAIHQLSVVEDIVGVLDLVSKSGVYAVTQDTEPQPSKWYFIATGTAVSNPTGDPHAQGWYELSSGIYSLTDDTTVTSGKTYYTLTAQVVDVGFDYILTRDTDIVEGKTYYTRSGSGTEQDPYVYTEVQNPVQADLGIYYEYTNSPTMHGYYELVSIDEAIQNYVSSHLTLADGSLFLQTDEGDASTRLELNTTDGMILYDQNGHRIAQYGSSVLIGDPNSFHVAITNNRLSFYRDSVNEVAYISGDKLYITQSVVLRQMDVGETVANGGLGQWSWKVHEINNANNLYLKWIG